jgi:hypothetical protein
MTIESFAAEYHKMKSKEGTGTRRPLLFAGLAPLPQISAREDKQEVVYWLRENLLCPPGAQQKGETDGNATNIAEKNKVGHPRKSTDDKDVPADKHKHRYLEREDGTPISLLDLRLLSQKAREFWGTLLEHRYAPKTWGKVSSVAWDFYARSMLNVPGLEFLQLCDDGQWKLREWTQQNYSGWAWRNGLREARPKKEPAETSNLDNKDLFQMEPSEEPEVVDAEESSDDTDLHDTTDVQDPKGDSGSGISESESESTIGWRASVRENLRPQVYPPFPPPYLALTLWHTPQFVMTQTKSVVVNPLYALLYSSHFS